MKTLTVDAAALKQVLEAVVGPPHLIAELKVLMSLPDSPVQKLIDDYKTAYTADLEDFAYMTACDLAFSTCLDCRHHNECERYSAHRATTEETPT